MNIIFIDNADISLTNNINKLDSYLFNIFGFYIKKMNNKNIYYININDKIMSRKIFKRMFALITKNKFKKDNNYIVVSKTLDENNINVLLNEMPKPVFVSGQNNLYDNDEIYIDEYVNKNNIDKKEIKVLLVVDKFDHLEKRKMDELLQKYKIVDIYVTNHVKNLNEYIEKVNNKLGTVVEIIDKIPKEYYNILLVFSKKYEIHKTRGSFILDYNNSDLDVKSNTYLLYKNNKKIYDIIFKQLNMDMSRFEKTKLGKLYIHARGLMLDI